MDWKVRSITQLLGFVCLLAAIDYVSAEQRVVCYYTNWSVYRPGTAKFSPQNINPYLCTHLIYAFGGFTKENTLKPFDKYQDIEKGGYAKFTGLKTYNKNLKTMLAVGGWNEGSSRFSPMVASPDRRKEFVRNTVKFLRQNHFDGLDLDWEYPAFRDGGKPRDRENYAALVQELREEYERESSKTGRPRLLLSMAVPAGIEYIDKGYDIPKLNKYLDFINLLSYDYHSSYEPAVNHHSPLYPLEEDDEYNFDSELTVDYTIKHLLNSGASADKIVLGIPTYGRSYTLFNEDATDLGSPADGPGEEGDATREKGYLAYYEICENLLNSDEWEIVSPNPNAMGPYAYKGNQWVGYDDEAIVRLKAKYVTENGLGGIMFWSIDNDDFRGKCHDRPYPLIEAAKEAMLTGSEKTSVQQKLSRPTKTRTDSNFIGRKIEGSRRRTTEASVIVRQNNPRKRVNSLRSKTRANTRQNSDEEETQVQANGRNRGQFYDSEENEDISDNSKTGANIVRSIEYSEEESKEKTRPQNRNRVRNGQGRRRKPEGSRRRSTTASSISEAITAQAGNSRITTPEPPTTPDPGTDFKCEDEGFFSHPRDCKKYFWCLDAGPGGLGIVAHHFTCPAGLVFNKAADSCDYPRNVVCPKTKTTEGPTTRAPIIAATSRTTKIRTTTRRSSTTTTTEPTEYSEEYEYYDDDEDVSNEDNVPVTTTTARALQYKTISRNRPTTTTTTPAPTTSTQAPKTVTSRTYQGIPSRSSSVSPLMSIAESEEDPKVLKELIELIKKAGGIEELEKQLYLQSKGSESNVQTGPATDKAVITPATISRSLYERVLNRQAANGGNALFRRTTVSPTTVQKEVAEILDSQASITQRSKPSFQNGPGQAQFEGLDELPEVKSLRRKRPEYVTITRNRPSTESPDEDNNESIGESTDESSEEKVTIDQPEVTPSAQRETPGYVDIRRSRTTTTKSNVLDEENEENAYDQQHRRPIVTDTGSDDEDDTGSIYLQSTTEAVIVRRRNQFSVQDKTPSTSRYSTIQRVRSTTQATEETSSEDNHEVIENTAKSTESSIEDILTTTSNKKSDDKISVPETSISKEAEVFSTMMPITQPISTQSTNFVSTELPVQNIDPTSTALPLTVESIEEYSPTTAPSPTVGSSVTQEPSSDEVVTKGSTTIAQTRPFGFQRRTRPTTTTTTLTQTQEPTTSSVSSDTGRVKVPSETVKLPTLKELIGYNTIVATDYTSTTPITLSFKNLLDDDTIIPNEYNKYISATVTPAPNKELLSEELTSTNDTGIKTEVQIGEEDHTIKYQTVKTAENNEYIDGVEDNDISLSSKLTTTTEWFVPATIPIKILKQEEEVKPRQRKVKLVNIPVRILEADRHLTDVTLEVPEYKVNSILRSLLRVEIIKQDNVTNGDSKESKNTKINGHRTSYSNTNQNHVRDDLSEEHESNEILNQDANTNSIQTENLFTSTTPSISTVRGHLLVTPQKSRNRGFYVTKSIESYTSYENVTPPINSEVTESNEELTQEFSTTAEQLSTSTNSPLIVETDSTITKDDFSTSQEESASEESLPTMITTSLENFNNILALNDDVGSTTVITQKPTTVFGITSTDYLTSMETSSNVKSTIEPASTEYNRDYSSVSEEESGTISASTEYLTSMETWSNVKSTIEPVSTEYDRDYLSVSEEESGTISASTEYLTSMETLSNVKSTVEPASTEYDRDYLSVSEEESGTISASTEYLTSMETLSNVKSTVEPASTEYDRDYTSVSEEKSGKISSDDFSSTDSEEIFEHKANTDTPSTPAASKINTVDENSNYYTATNTPILHRRDTTINQNTDTVTESSTLSFATKQSSTGFSFYNETTTTDFSKLTISDLEASSEETSTVTHDNSVSETSTVDPEVTTFTGDFNTYFNTNLPEYQKTTVSDLGSISEALNTITPDIASTTSGQNTDSIKASDTTGSNFYIETTTSKFQKTTTFDSDVTSDTTSFLGTETNTPQITNAVIDTEITEFSNKVNSNTNTSTMESTSDFKSTIDTKSNELITDEPFDNKFIPHSKTTDSEIKTTNSFWGSNVETTTAGVDSETSTLNFVATNSASTVVIASDSITTAFPLMTIANEIKTDSSTDEYINNIEMETKTTISNKRDSTSESHNTVETSTLEMDLTDSTKINQQTNVQTVNTLNISGLESTVPLPDDVYSETTTVSTTTKKDESVNETVMQQNVENVTQKHKACVSTQSVDPAFSTAFYRSPSALPENKSGRKRIIRKRIYGVRRPHVQTVSENETATDTRIFNAQPRWNATINPKQKFIRRRIINRTTGKVVEEMLKENPTILQSQNIINNSNRQLIENTYELSNREDNQKKNLLIHRTIYRRRLAKNKINQTNTTVEADISSQNNSASNDVQSSSVSSTNFNQQRKIGIGRFRYRGTGLTKLSTVSPSSSSSSQSLLVTNISQLGSTENIVEDNLLKRKTSGQDYTDDTVDNLSSDSESYGRVFVHGKEELPRTESISEAQLEFEPALMSEDKQADGEINLFKTRASSPRLPGTLVRQPRPSTSLSIPENEVSTTVSPSSKRLNNIAPRRRFRLGQRPSTGTNNVGLQNQPTPGDDETSKSERDEDVSENLDQSSNAQEVEVTVADRDSSSPTPSAVTGRPPFRTSIRRRIITTRAPQVTVSSTVPTIIRQRQRPKPFEKVSENQTPARPRHPAIIDYDYYEDSEERIVGKPKLAGKISITARGGIRCLDQGNFPHPTSCKKFITCARMVDGQVIGTEYTCPKRLSFDPVGGICNWSAGLGCKE